VSGDLDEAGRTGLRAAFREAALGRLDALERLLEEGALDTDALSREAHTLRGSASVVELQEITALAAELELALRDRMPGRAAELVTRLRALVEALPAAPEEAATSLRSAGPAVLYIEDDRPNALLVERILRRRPGIRLLDAPTGSEGIRLAREQRPALVLLDLRLPDMHGLEVLRWLRADPRTAGLPVAVITGGAEPETLERLEAAGVPEVIAKPFDVERLLAVVDAALDSRQPPP
jgi:CheY-like chemotaxis protein/HPt (histidine-containing phosphotransfer) domain-containing protein